MSSKIKKDVQFSNFNNDTLSSKTNNLLEADENSRFNTTFENKKLVLSLNEDRKICEQIVYTKKAKLILLRRYSGPPTMACFSDFMFLYIGNNEELDDVRFEHISDSLTFTKKLHEFNKDLVKNRFNFLMYNSKVYKNLLFNDKIKPQIFSICYDLIKYIEYLIYPQSNNYDIDINNQSSKNFNSSESKTLKFE
jgi:hypothetical protein